MRALALLLALGAAQVAQAAQAAQADDAGDRAALAAQAEAWDQAIVRKDRAAIEAPICADFRQIDGDGAIENKTSFIASLLDPKLTIKPYTVEDFEIRVYGDVALLSGRTRMQGDYAGKPFASHYRYIDIYRRLPGRWCIASVQITRMAN